MNNESTARPPSRSAKSDLGWMVGLLAILVAAYSGFAYWRRSNSLNGAVPAAGPNGVTRVRVKADDYLLGAGERPRLGTLMVPDLPNVEPPKAMVPDEWQRRGFVSVESCQECHADKYESFAGTAHAVTAAPATLQSVRGAFDDGRNLLRTAFAGLEFHMESREGRLYQSARFYGGDERLEHRQRIDIVTGSGNHGQTYLYWSGDQLFQLPVSYFRGTQRWVNSPGYVNGVADFARPIVPRCLECHSTFAQVVEGSTNRYVPDSLVLGITCQRCHGPGQEHVTYHRDHPDSNEVRGMLKPAALPVVRQIQMCEQCHSGGDRSLRPHWTYRPGEPLEEYLEVLQRTDEVQGDVHTINQSARIRLSKCYQASPELTCTRCHDPHRSEQGDDALFSGRCAQCHQLEDCRSAKRDPARCVVCHMPQEQDRETELIGTDGIKFRQVRDHWIRVLPKAQAKTQ